MKRLRILTGFHAGASMALDVGTWRVLSEAEAERAEDEPGEHDIVLHDGPPHALALEVAEDGQVTVRTPGDDQAVAWDEMTPRRFGELVLCVGEESAPWPSDTSLIAQVFAPSPASTPAQPPAPSRPMRKHLAWVAFAIGAALLAPLAMAFYGGSKPVSTIAAYKGPSASALRQALNDPAYQDLSIVEREGKPVINGLVGTVAEDEALRRKLVQLKATHAVPNWDVASRLADTLQTSALALFTTPGSKLSVKHLGGGRFYIEGTVQDPELLQRSIARLQLDLGPNARSVEVAVAKVAGPSRITSAVNAGNVTYTEGVDGTKIFNEGQR